MHEFLDTVFFGCRGVISRVAVLEPTAPDSLFYWSPPYIQPMVPTKHKESTVKTFVHEFADSGAKVICQKVSPFIASEARAAAQAGKPQPPVRVVDEEGPLKGTSEVMDKDPAYLELVRQWARKSDELLMRLQIKRAIKEVVEPENWQEQVMEYRIQREDINAELKTLNPSYNPDPLPEDDMTVFILFIAAATQDDLTEFVNDISRRSYPSGEAIAGAKESFRPGVQTP